MPVTKIEKNAHKSSTVQITKRNHYNPCFWTAYWNSEYYALARGGTSEMPEARKQVVHALSAKSGTIRQTIVDDVHFEKQLGVAEISRESAEDFVRRHHPDKLKRFLRDNEGAIYPVYLDFEPIFTGIEAMPPYQVLPQVIKQGQVRTIEEKTNLCAFLLLQQIRSHAVMSSMIEWHQQTQREKFEHFITLKWLLETPEALLRIIYPLVAAQWTFFQTDVDKFPLCDTPILSASDSIMVALSPCLLLEIEPQAQSESLCRVRSSVPGNKLANFRRRMIGNTFRDIIFADENTLKNWSRTPQFASRLKFIRGLKSYNQLVGINGSKELWKINAFSCSLS